MLKKTNLLMTVLLAWGAVMGAYAQYAGPCNIASCQQDTFLVRTGYDYDTGTLEPVGTQTGYWELTQAPSSVQLPSPVWVIAPDWAWQTLPNSRWISAYNTASFNTNNPAPAPPYTFQQCFCTCLGDSVTISLDVLADDIVSVYLDTMLLGNFTAGYYFSLNKKIVINTKRFLPAGNHCLRFHVRNTGNTAFGLNVSGFLKGGSILKPNCCNSTGSICGVKYNDLDGDGVQDANEGVLKGWKIVLKGENGYPIDTVTTDTFGNYCFRNLAPSQGPFRVQELNQLNWNQRQPATAAGYLLEVEVNKVKRAVFGNQNNCQASACATDTLRIRTGYDHQASALLGPGSRDTYWELIQAPGNVTLPAPTWVINPYPSWNTLSQSRWISAYQSAYYNTNNPAPASPYSFQHCFCTCEQGTVRVHLEMLVDDIVSVSLNGINLGTYTAGYYFLSQNKITIDTSLALGAGTHCLRFDVRNTGGSAFGLNVNGYVSGGAVRQHGCCNPSGNICGVKYSDLNGNGQRDSGEPTLAGWSIILSDTLGNDLDTIVTDANGNYCFMHLLPDYYKVREINRPGWSQLEPVAATGYRLNLAARQTLTAVFGNARCGGPPDPCFDLPDSICKDEPIVPLITCDMGDIVWHQWVVTELNGAWEDRVVKGNFPFNGVPSSFDIRTLWNGFIPGKCYGISLDVFDSCGNSKTEYEFFCIKLPVVHTRNYTICMNINPCRVFNMNDPTWPCPSGNGSWDVTEPNGLGYMTNNPQVIFCGPNSGTYTIKTNTADGCECIVTGNIDVQYNCLEGGGGGGQGKRPLSTGSENTRDPLIIYPNPSQGTFVLEYSGDLQGMQVQILDVLGRVLMQAPLERRMEMNMTDRQAGIYTLILSGGGEQAVYKLLLTRD